MIPEKTMMAVMTPEKTMTAMMTPEKMMTAVMIPERMMTAVMIPERMMTALMIPEKMMMATMMEKMTAIRMTATIPATQTMETEMMPATVETAVPVLIWHLPLIIPLSTKHV